MYDVGMTVRVCAMMPPGHIRTPAYLRGKTGVIERRLGSFANPEMLAYRLPAGLVALYRVRFRMADLWGTPNPDMLEAEIFAHWLEPVEERDAA